MDLNAFFKRIQFQGDVSINLQTLNALQTAFVHTVPFENLVIHLGQGINYESDAVFDKIVTRGLGGVCYENNTLFYDALMAMGFDAQLIASEMNPDPEKELSVFTHAAVLVTFSDGQYLVDVGNGRNFGGALAIDGSVNTFAEGYEYKIAPYDERHLGLFARDLNQGKGQKPGEWESPNADQPGGWIIRYAIQPALPAQTRSYFKDACDNIQNSPDSIFRQKRLATLPKACSRITFSDYFWIEKSDDGQRIDKDIPESEYLSVLKRDFGLNYSL
ncbi:hypothetical protein GZ77_22350 [Endozoicomonas montiporae]|uniref:Acetyltransferase n=2 Tax=Endozoicomonas montiporae TaxID=1027273 RepID=A0A081N094_9GAMM|nr:arylamine N-acetyltransferase [Endozoicomonas montiporae]AMO54320.1 N-hydroxyarylamine O-acetyltransferase [Endozoicomonas montiporae CL-33]KEQ11867.1 hypothetical protein GZ77_22350 [Endozoicomonas montiporae]